ncbi:MAG TPA: hypothetical protein VIN08_01345 [Ohtaekwangia sp.]|uniref:hypothetical protein n=1 Tax=Ohtaekwangia sp. TaxID=2066019 RepID=UPI002F942773
MKRILVITIILITVSYAKSQEIKSEILNSECKYKTTLLDSVLSKFQSIASQIKDTAYVDNKISVKERIAFLNKDFNTSNFSKACEIRCTDFFLKNTLHLGIIDIALGEIDKDRCVEVIKNVKRQNFKTKVLTRFKIIEKPNELVIMYSETPFNSTVEKLFSF